MVIEDLTRSGQLDVQSAIFKANEILHFDQPTSEEASEVPATPPVPEMAAANDAALADLRKMLGGIV